jgi:hypothetical protein
MLEEMAMSVAEEEQHEEIPYWVASWAELDPEHASIHRYFFAAADQEAAMEKVFAQMNRAGTRLPEDARILRREWVAAHVPEHPLLIWQISWQEAGEKHLLLLFDPADRPGAIKRAALWSLLRCETIAQFQMLQRVPDARRAEALFDPNEGEQMFL